MKKLIIPACLAGVAIGMIVHPYEGSSTLLGGVLLAWAVLSALPDHPVNNS